MTKEPRTPAQTKAEQETAFRQGYTDNAHGIKRDACPYELGKDMNDLRRKWWEGWDKSERGLAIRLPGAS